MLTIQEVPERIDIGWLVQYALPLSIQQLFSTVMGKVKDAIVAGVIQGISDSGILEKVHTLVEMNAGVAVEEVELGKYRGRKKVINLEPRQCDAEGCDRLSRAKGLCTRHYQQKRYVEKQQGKVLKKYRKGTVDLDLPKQGLGDLIDKVLNKKDTQLMTQPKKHKEALPCAVEGCGKPALTRGLCSKHYQKQLRIENNEKYHVGEKWQTAN